MNERDKELWVQSQQWDSSDDGRSKLKIFESVEKFADLIRADAMETATHAANESWTLLAKALVLAEREACAQMVEDLNDIGHSYGLENRIRARGNT